MRGTTHAPDLDHLHNRETVTNIETITDNLLNYPLLNRDKKYQGYTAGQIVYLYFPGASMLNTGSRKIRCEFVGPLAIWKYVSSTQFLLMSLDGKLYPYLIEETRIKSGFVRTTKGNVIHMSGLRQVIKTGELLDKVQNVK